jgi:hypothetical protein
VENFFRWNFPTSVNVRSLPSRGTRAPPRVHLFGKKKKPCLCQARRLCSSPPPGSPPPAPGLPPPRGFPLPAPRFPPPRPLWWRYAGGAAAGRVVVTGGATAGMAAVAGGAIASRGSVAPTSPVACRKAGGKLGFSPPTGTAAATPRIDPPSPSGIAVVEVAAVIRGRHHRTTTPPSGIAIAGSGSPPSGIAVAFRDCRRRLPFAPRSHTMPFSLVILPPPMLCALLILYFCLCSCSN